MNREEELKRLRRAVKETLPGSDEEQAIQQQIEELESKTFTLSNLKASQTKSCLRLLEKSPDGSDNLLLNTRATFITIGRSPTSDVQFEDTDVSWEHGNIFYSEDEYVYRHVSKTNPTIIQRHREEFHLSHDLATELVLKNRDLILFGKHTILIQFTIGSDLRNLFYAKTEPAPKTLPPSLRPFPPTKIELGQKPSSSRLQSYRSGLIRLLAGWWHRLMYLIRKKW